MANKRKVIFVQAVYRPRLDSFVVLFGRKIVYRTQDQASADAFVKGWNDQASAREV